MEDAPTGDTAKPNKDSEQHEASGLDWLLGKENPEVTSAPMDTNSSLSRQYSSRTDGIFPSAFSREKVFEAASCRDATQLSGLLDYLRANNKKLTGPEFTDEITGKTALLKALLNLKDGKNDTIEVFLHIAEQTGDLDHLINASYKDPSFKGQTPLHVAIERRSFDHVRLLVQKGADVQAKANGKFFQQNSGPGFYFGELPLSLAACTNQPDVVSFLMENPFRRADVTDRDSQGNTVLHALVVLADNTTENTDTLANMYDQILIQHHKLEKKDAVQLETIENNQRLTPLKLAAKLGKIGLLTHMLHREFKEEEMRPLSRKFTEWVYGPVHSSLYDMTDIDTSEENSVLEIVVFGSEIPDKWDRFASKLFFMNFLLYLLYLSIFTTVAFYRKEGQPPFPIEDDPIDHLRCVGELLSVLGALWFFYKAIIIFRRNPSTFRALYTDGFCDILFFLQAALLLVCTVLYVCGRREYVGLLVLSLALAWINVLYYSRGSRRLGKYSVMMQRMILGDLLHFLCVYSVLLLGFSAAIVALIEDSHPDQKTRTNSTQTRGRSFGVETFKCKKPSYNDIRFTTLELFKITIGMGDLEFTDHVQYKEVFYILLISYIVLTYILLLNMLIALMGNTVERISQESENIWNLQRAFTILDMEWTLSRCLSRVLHSRMSKMVCLRGGRDERRFFRVEEMNWRQWKSDLSVIREEDPGDLMMKPPVHKQPSGNLWNLSPLLQRIRARRQPPSSEHQHLRMHHI